MKKLTCNICGKLLLEAKVNSHIRKICPRCKAKLEIKVTSDGIEYNNSDSRSP